jgi:hypothetical protein
MPRNLADLAASVHRTSEALEKAPRAGVFQASMHTKTLILAQIVTAIGADRRLSNLKRGGPLNVGFNIVGTTNPTSMIKARGFYFAWVEEGTHPHQITPKGSRRTKRGNRRSGAKGLTIDGGVYAHANHPGTEGKHPFAKGVNLARPMVPGIFQAETRKAVIRSW